MVVAVVLLLLLLLLLLLQRAAAVRTAPVRAGHTLHHQPEHRVHSSSISYQGTTMMAAARDQPVRYRCRRLGINHQEFKSVRSPILFNGQTNCILDAEGAPRYAAAKIARHP